MRILVTISPLLYREVLALSLHRHSPDFEVLLAPPWSLDGEADALRPHVLVHDAGEGEELPPGLADDVLCRVRINIAERVDARIELDGTASEVYDISLARLFAALDEAEGLSRGDVGERPTTVPLKAHRGRRLRPRW